MHISKHYEIDEQTRKFHYYRGFRSALIIISPFVAVLMLATYMLIGLIK